MDEQRVIDAIDEGKTVLDVLPKHDKPWFYYRHLLKLNFFLLAPILAQIVSGFDGSMMNGLQSINEWQEYFGHPNSVRLGTMNNGGTIGTLISIPFVAFLVDYLGRRIALIAGCVVIVIGAILQGAAQNFGMFMAARILLGIGSCLSSTAASPLITECAYPNQRAAMTGMLLASWPFGAFVAALVTWGPYNSPLVTTSWSWRIPSILQGFFPLLQILVAIWMPESPRWLVAHDKVEKARNFFVRYHADGDENSLVVEYQMAEVIATLQQEKEQKMARWSNWLKTSGMRHRLAICLIVPAMLQLEGNALISYYLHIILDNIGLDDSITQLKINLGLTVWSLIASIVVASIADRLRRRTMFFTGLITMFITYVLWTILSAINQERNFSDPALARGVVFFIYLYNGLNPFCAIVGTPYVMEIARMFYKN